MGHRHGVQEPIQFTRPKLQELSKLREVWVQIVLLPNVVLMDLGMVGHAVEYIGGGEAEPLNLTAELKACHADSPKTQPSDRVIENARLQPLFRKRCAISYCWQHLRESAN